MRKIIVVLSAIFLLLFISACGENSSTESTNNSTGTETGNDNSEGTESNETVELRLGHAVQGENHPYHMAARHYADLVEEKSNGEISIEIFPGGQLGGELDMLEMVQNGTLDAALISASIFSGSTPVMDGLTIPFLFDNYTTFNEALKTDVAQQMLDSLEELQLKGLGFNNAGMRHVGSNVAPVEDPEDFSDLKIRVMESPLMLDIFETLGANPTPMAYGELYSALQTGVIDAHETNLISFTDENFHEVTEYISLLSIYPTPNINIMNLSSYNEMSDEHKEVLTEAGHETSTWIVEQMEEIDKEALEELKDLDKNINEIDDMQVFIDKVQPIYDEYGDKHPLIKEFITTVEDIKN
ncbi:TRAP transporter substrate-binding protein [Virgibacillus sp. W0181]|uniref:TRAP transporter substrate-binding protein n=1 Tax=Virgibacillus sp. W0181 TaxID=3391581 RepID=UPI003F45DFAA